MRVVRDLRWWRTVAATATGTATLAVSACGLLTTSAPSPAPAGRTANPAPAVRAAPSVVAAESFDRSLDAERRAAVGAGRRLDPERAGYYLDVQEARFRQIGTGMLQVRRVGEQLVLAFPGHLTFESGRANLSPAAIRALTEVAGVLREFDLSIVSAHGHTDSTGDASVNQRLSEQRALAVATHLMSQGVAATRLVVVGHGARSPVATNGTEEGRSTNRRVELRIDLLVAPAPNR